MILIYLAQLPLFAAGLWLGAGAATFAGLVAAAILVAAGNLMVAAVFGALNVIPVILLVRLSLLARTGHDGQITWYPPGFLTAWLSGLGLAAAAATIVFLGGRQGMQAALREVLTPALDRGLDVVPPEHDELLELLAFVLPGIVATSWMVMTATNG